MKNKGITLIALVITIIILLILAGISVSTLTNQGILKNAKEAKERSENAQKKEQEILSQYENEMNQYNKDTIAYKVNNGEIKIGDYIKYTPDTVSTEEILQELNQYSGSEANTTSTLKQEALNWRVLDIKAGRVRLISETPTASTIALSGYNGYNNAVKLLDDTCSTLYNNSKLASKVQNLKIEDIQDKMVETNYTSITSDYGKTFRPTDKYYPSILVKEKEQKVNETIVTELNVSEQKELINQTIRQQATSLEVKYTYWSKSMMEDDFSNSIYYNLFINNGNNYPIYWMSSRCINSFQGNARFNIRRVAEGAVRAYGIYISNDNEYPITYGFRPVITINSSIQIDTENSGDGSSPEQAYLLK